MLDTICVAASVGFFLFSVAYTHACEHPVLGATGACVGDAEA